MVKGLLLIVSLLLLFIAPAIAQPVVVVNGTQVTWDYDTAAVGVDGFRIYMSQTSPVVPDGVSFVGSVIFPALEWTILAPGPGKWYMVATAHGDSAESGPSNELEIVVIGKPTNLRVK